ncbi:MAG: hypothetical protein U0169_19710 [Polyangiaceae bacterium]
MIVVGTDTDGLADELVVARLVEGLGATPPALVDACAFVHGPWQAIHDRSAVIVCVGRDDATNRALVRRVESCLVEGRHTLVTFTSDLAGPLAAVAIDAALVVAVARALPSVSWDLVAWPGKGDDGPLYDLGAHALDGMIARTRT